VKADCIIQYGKHISGISYATHKRFTDSWLPECEQLRVPLGLRWQRHCGDYGTQRQLAATAVAYPTHIPALNLRTNVIIRLSL
jgi:hypothetical protein